MLRIKILIILLLCFWGGLKAFSQNMHSPENEKLVHSLIDSLWENPTSFFNNSDANWRLLCDNLYQMDKATLDDITHSIYNGSDAIIENESTSADGVLGKLNFKSHKKRIKKFDRKIKDEFNNKTLYPDHKVVLVEGDSWLEFPMFLKETTDDLLKEKNLAVYSIASGGDWVANMVASGEYKDEYSNFKPDVFIISGGGNDMLEDQRLKRLIADIPINADSPFLKDYREYVVLRQNHIPVSMCNANYCPIEYHLYVDSLPRYKANLDNATIEKIVNGRRYINKNFYRWLVAFKLEYKILFESLRKIDVSHFDSLKIITQGYDYAIPSSTKKFGVRLFMDNGKWLKNPLESLGITDQYTQESTIMTMMFDFNEMLIELGKEFPNIYHVDVRGFTRFLEEYDNKKPGKYWYDELHPTHRIFAEIAKVYIAIINNRVPKNQHVFRVKDFFQENNSNP